MDERMHGCLVACLYFACVRLSDCLRVRSFACMHLDQNLGTMHACTQAGKHACTHRLYVCMYVPIDVCTYVHAHVMQACLHVHIKVGW